jgi:hypothetical protein
MKYRRRLKKQCLAAVLASVFAFLSCELAQAQTAALKINTGYAPGYWYRKPLGSSGAAGSAYGSAGRVTCAPYYVTGPSGMTASAVGATLATTDASNYASFAIYTASGNFPGSLVDSIPAQKLATAGGVSGALAKGTGTLTPGAYFPCSASNSPTAVFVGVTNSGASPSSSTMESSTLGHSATQSAHTAVTCSGGSSGCGPAWAAGGGSSHTWPSSLASTTWSAATGTNMPLMSVQSASLQSGGFCSQIPGTSIFAGAGCLARSSYPALHSPVNPLSYGADPTGAKNSASAFQRAVSSGHDVHVICPSAAPCTYMISDASTRFPVFISTNVNIQCDANVTLYNPDHDTKYTGMLWFSGVSGGGVQGCNMKGANSGPSPLTLDTNEANHLILVQESSNLLFEGNIFGNTWANSALYFGTANTGPGVTNSTVQYNTFTANPLYGAAIVSGGSDRIKNNLMIDSETGVEANNESNNALAMSGHISISQNIAVYTNGGCEAAGNSGCNYGIGFTAGGSVSNFNRGTFPYYATNTVTGNFCTGSGVQHALIRDTWNRYVSPPPTYSNNILGPGCTCDSGAGSC